VLGQSLVAQKTLDLPAGDSTIDLPVTADWGAGAYATVILHRPMETKRKRMPSRALGLVWIKRNLSDAALNVTIGGPKKVRSGGTVTLPISVAGGTPDEPAFVTVAAVDTGILNLTGFKAPNPSKVLEGQTKLGAEIRDLYGRLIDGMSAEAGSFRTGGDAGGGPQMQGPPPVEATVALFSGIVAVDGDGNAQVTFDLPPFNGSVRLMAVAWNGAQIGHGTRDMTVRDPVALTLGAPRFLTLGDTTKLRVDAHNVEGPSGDYRVTVRSALDGAPARDVLTKTVTLAPNARQAIVVPFAPRDVGLTTVTVTVAGPNGIAVTRDLTFDVKPAAGDIKRHLVLRLGEGESITLSADLFADMIARDAQVGVSVGPAAQFDVPGLLASLDRYPYGCTEQTISRALPLLYANALSADGGLATDNELGPRIERAIARVLARQDSSGAFGIWSPYGSNLWLTAYAADFLSRAREAGYAISERAFAQTLDRLANYVGYTQEVRDGGAELSYALYVLARHKRAAAGTLRYFAETRLSDFQSAAAKAQLGAALAMIGDTDRARRVFANAAARATATTDKAPREDFGSAIRDAAAVVALAAEARMLSDVGTALDQLKAALAKRPALSTQDQAWAVRAAAALSTQASDVQLDVGGTPHTGALTRMFTHASLSDGAVTIRNTGPATDLIVTTTGSAKTPEPAAANGFAIERAYYTLDGKPIDLASARGGQSTVQQTERMVVVLTVRPEERTGRLLLVDRLPAGLEIENPRLVDGGSISALSWLTSPVQPVHTEFRDDRFVA
ncbi:MAG: alpha-2-macroglobulin family protein, partial [Pseudomonadota bacterium]